MKKILLATIMSFGLFVGSASAATVTLASFDILTLGDGITPNPGGAETDTRAYTESTDAGGADVPVEHWIGLDVIIPMLTATLTAEDQSQPGGTTTNLDIELYAATVAGSDWTTGALLDAALPSPMLINLAMGTYLVKISGDLPAGLVDLTHNYGLRVTSVVPVPAAVWLFGTALLGLFGYRRRQQAAAA